MKGKCIVAQSGGPTAVKGEVKPVLKDGLPEFMRFEKHFINKA